MLVVFIGWSFVLTSFSWMWELKLKHKQVRFKANGQKDSTKTTENHYWNNHLQWLFTIMPNHELQCTRSIKQTITLAILIVTDRFSITKSWLCQNKLRKNWEKFYITTLIPSCQPMILLFCQLLDADIFRMKTTQQCLLASNIFQQALLPWNWTKNLDWLYTQKH